MIDLDMPYPLATALEMIPMPSMNSLYLFLSKFKDEFPGLYRRTRIPIRNGGTLGVEQRFMTGRQILRARELQYHGWEDTRYARRSQNGRPRGTGSTRSSHPLAYIMERASA